MSLWLQRYSSGGTQAASGGNIVTYMHQEAATPATVSGAPPAYPRPTLGGTAHAWGQLAWGAAGEAALSAEHVSYLRDSNSSWKGIALHQSTGKDYVILYSLSEQTSQGRIGISHLG
jgi:hypothetical protein